MARWQGQRPARRVLVIAGVALALVVALLLVLLLRPRPPVRGPAAPLSAAGPVLLVPGYGGGTDGLEQLAQRLRAQGRQAEVIPVGDGTGDLTGYAATVLTRAQALVAEGAPSVDLVGFSAGGITVRIAATVGSGEPLVRRVVQLAAPNGGTNLAALGELLRQCPTACQQITPDSEVLAALPEANAADRWLSLWTDSDEVIRPADSSVLDGATDLRLQSICAGEVGHSGLVADPVTAVLVGGFLDTGRVPAACPG